MPSDGHVEEISWKWRWEKNSPAIAAPLSNTRTTFPPAEPVRRWSLSLKMISAGLGGVYRAYSPHSHSHCSAPVLCGNGGNIGNHPDPDTTLGQRIYFYHYNILTG